MKKLLPLLFIAALALWAADFWQAKPFTSWDQKEVQKILTDSPWARKLTVAMPGFGGGGGGNPGGGGGGGGKGGRGGPAGPNNDPGIAGGGGGGIAESSGGGGRGGGFGGGGGDAPAAVATPSIPLLVSCRSALPIREALARFKFGADAGTAPDAKKLVEDPQMYYIIEVGGLPGYVQPRDNEAKQALMKDSSLTAKGKDPLIPADIQFAQDGRNVDAYFIFPRMVQFTADDKEIEFIAKAGGLSIKQKFNLKNMVINGKLEM